MNKVFAAAILIVPLIASCSDDGGSLANKAGDQVGQVITDFAGGMGKGIDKQMTINVELSDKVVASGLAMSVAKQDSLASKSIVLYLIASTDFEGKLLAKAMNDQGAEIGRTTAELKLAKDEAEYVYFKFHEEMDSQMVNRYQLDKL